ncbi:MAG: cyclic nucleotide-binding domain-containing protein [Gammaproteobacteria bacterium]|nr:cyclic nucleotide-binding domain-containing protein [Gammaproteobacteria bacterium]
MNSSEKLVQLLANNILFRDVPATDLQHILPFLEFQTFNSKTMIYQQGDNISGLYLIVNGQVQSYVQRGSLQYSLSHASANHLFGEFLLSGHSIRSSNAITIEDTETALLKIDDVKKLFSQIPETMSLIRERISRRLAWNQTIQALSLSHLFKDLDENIVREVINDMEVFSVKSNHVLINQGEAPTELYIVIHGKFQIIKNLDNSEKQWLGIISRGESLGEKGLVLSSKRNSEVRAVRDSTVAKLSRESFQKILKKFPIEVNHAFTGNLFSSFKQGKDHINSAETFTLIPLSKNINGKEIADQLSQTLVDYGNTYVLDSKKIDQAFNKKDISQQAFNDQNDDLLPWLFEQEITHRHVIYVVDNQINHWTKRCLRQTDHILLVVDANDNQSIGEFEQQIYDSLGDKKIKVTLLIIHNENVLSPENTAQWLTPRKLDIHHHVRRNNQTDISRVARFLTNNAISLVMGGGGARGFAHAGVIRAFEELNIPIDMICGNSMGAIMAAQYAMQWQPEKMIQDTQDFCLKGDSFTIPIVSIFSGKKMTSGFKNMYNERQIEDLWLHFFSISCNISRATIVTHNTGPLWDAVLKSNTPPGLFPPQIENGDLFVDGALLNNIPVDIMKEMNPLGKIIAVDVSAREDLLNNTDNHGGISGLSILWNKLNPLSKNKIHMPHLAETLGRASIIGGLAKRKKNMSGIADLYIEPPLGQFSLMGYKEADKIAQVGYEYTKEQLAEWLNKSG